MTLNAFGESVVLVLTATRTSSIVPPQVGAGVVLYDVSADQ